MAESDSVGAGTTYDRSVTEISPEFQRGWDAALMAVRFWQALIQARRSGFPKKIRARSRGPSEVRRDDSRAKPGRHGGVVNGLSKVG
jgi:hypothetical protein